MQGVSRPTIWQWTLSDGAESLAQRMESACLDDAEKQRARRFINPTHALYFCNAHIGLRERLAQHVQCKPEDIAYGWGEFGKPYLLNFPHVHFNLSHSADLALMAISDCPVGVDVEKLEHIRLSHGLLERVLHPAEIAQLRQTANDQQAHHFAMFWVLKEAILKARGCGLRVAPGSLNVSEFVTRAWPLKEQYCGALYEGHARVWHVPQRRASFAVYKIG